MCVAKCTKRTDAPISAFQRMLLNAILSETQRRKQHRNIGTSSLGSLVENPCSSSCTVIPERLFMMCVASWNKCPLNTANNSKQKISNNNHSNFNKTIAT